MKRHTSSSIGAPLAEITAVDGTRRAERVKGIDRLARFNSKIALPVGNGRIVRTGLLMDLDPDKLGCIISNVLSDICHILGENPR